MLSVVLIEKQMVLELVERRWNIVEFFRWRWSPDQPLRSRRFPNRPVLWNNALHYFIRAKRRI